MLNNAQSDSCLNCRPMVKRDYKRKKKKGGKPSALTGKRPDHNKGLCKQ